MVFITVGYLKKIVEEIKKITLYCHAKDE